MTDTAKPEATEMDKAYNPAANEEKWYKFWNDHHYFAPDPTSTKPAWVCIMPPPNVTGALHQGHAMFVGVEDAYTRYHRMNGRPVLWLPGSDHAGISAETVVEKLIWKQEKKRKADLGREEFLKRVWSWMDEYRDVILNQMEKLGASADWSRSAFTMDEARQRAVRVAFKKLYDDGLIYRAARIVNWCPGSQTVISDLEVEMKEEPGFLWYINYPVKDQPGKFVTVATTRPETMLGDTGVAVNPGDERFQALVGKTLILPLMNREIPVVADDVIDASFGTGAVKTTPGHDQLDFEIGQRHNLPIINIMNKDATINENGGKYNGLDRFEARKQIVADLEELGLLTKTEPYTHNVPYSEKADVVVEPLVLDQWWVKIAPLAEPALQAALGDNPQVRFVPERFKKVYTDWMENIHDWAISRQLYWGHRIPIWYCDNCGLVQASADEVLAECAKCGETVKLRQDTDVLDTWFSSGMWPFSTLGWPDKTADLARFYPTATNGTEALMETASDILFFWVARMIMFGKYFMGNVPFQTVYLHGLVRDSKGQKMSKSKGNVLDPLESVKQYGSDALRFTLLTGSTPGVDVKLSDTRLADSRNFGNKLWNATRFITLSGLQGVPYTRPPLEATMPLADRWILSRADVLVEDVTRLIEQYQLGEAGRLLYNFLWSEFCDWYIEASKLRLNADSAEKLATQQVLVGTLETALRLLHPYMPFLSEELWHQLPHQGEALIVAQWPTATGTRDLTAITQFEALQEIIKGIRNAKSEAKVESKRVEAIIAAKPEAIAFIKAEAEFIERLAGVEMGKLQIIPVDEIKQAPDQAMSIVTDSATIYIPLAGLLDLNVERARLTKEQDDTAKLIERSEKNLNNPSFAERAPAAVVAKERENLASLQERLQALKVRLADLN